MFTSIILIAFGIFIFYLIIDFFMMGSNLNDYGEKWLRKFLWLWLPIYALWRLTKEMFLQKKK